MADDVPRPPGCVEVCLESVGSLAAPLLDPVQIVHREPGQGNSWISDPDTFPLGCLKVEGEGSKALGAHHLASGLEAEDRIPGPNNIPGSQRHAQLFDPRRQGGDEVLDKHPPDLVLIKVLAQPIQHNMVYEGLGGASGA